MGCARHQPRYYICRADQCAYRDRSLDIKSHRAPEKYSQGLCINFAQIRIYLFFLLALDLALLLDVQLWFLPRFLVTLIFFTSGTHNRFSFRNNDLRLIPSCRSILTRNSLRGKMERNRKLLIRGEDT